MAFTATFYNCSDDPRQLNKTLYNGITTSNIRPTENCDILNPTLELDYREDLADKNYVVIGAPFNRSYFITDMSITIGKKIIISCAVDVLQTYRDEINGVSSIIVRQENASLSMIADTSIMVKNYSMIDTYAFPERFNVAFGSYVMQVVGGD